MNDIQVKILTYINAHSKENVLLEDSGIFFKQDDSLSLTRKGNSLLSEHLKSYKFSIDLEFKSRHFINLTRKFSYPYYLSPRILVVYSSTDALMIKLSGLVNYLNK